LIDKIEKIDDASLLKKIVKGIKKVGQFFGKIFIIIENKIFGFFFGFFL